MEIPIQVAVQICSLYPNEPCCVRTIPQYIDGNANNLSVVPSNGSPTNHGNPGLVQLTIPTDKQNDNEIQSGIAVQHALPYGCSQEFLYRKTVLPMIGNFLEGFDTSFITYGQHGTGKTYSMFGPGFDCVFGESEQGIVQRSVRDIFANLTKRQRNCRFALNVAWIEICGNEVHDILGSRTVQCIGDVFQCLQIGMANRSQEASHSLFTITLEQQWVTANGLIQHRLSTASFCDASGTERMLSVDQFNHQISVPKDIGLQALERIVSTIIDPNFHTLDNGNINLINLFEETMLTKLLKDSFGGRAQTLLLLCISPLEQDIFETTLNLQFAQKVQFIKNQVVMNTFSDNGLPIGNFIDPMMLAMQTTSHHPIPLPQALHYDPAMSAMNKLNTATNPNAISMKFAAAQWLKLVSNAEGLFSKLLVNNSLNEQDRECIEEWMYLKQECDECLSSVDMVTNPRLLGPIQETDEPDEDSGSDDGGNIESIERPKTDSDLTGTIKCNRFTAEMESTENGTTQSDNESDSEDNMQQTEYLKEKMAELMISFSGKTNEMIEENYDDFIESNPKAVMHSFDGKDLAGIKSKRSSSVVIAAEPTGNTNKGRRKSIQPGGSNTDGLMLSSADLEHLQRVADEGIRNSQSLNLNNSVCREVAEFLESSNDMHPLRMANANKVQENLLKEIRKHNNNIAGKQKQIEKLKHNIEAIQKLIDEHATKVRIDAKAQLGRKESYLQSERDKCKKRIGNSRDKREKENLQTELKQLEEQLSEVIEMKKLSRVSDNGVKKNQHEVQQRQTKLNELEKSLKKERKSLEKLKAKYEHECMKDDKKSIILATNVDTRIDQLDNVLKEKIKYLRINAGESEESIRHEIRNLRSERDRLSEAQCILRLKLNKEKKLSEDEARRMLEIDVAKDVFDDAMEYKNQMICGRDASNKNAFFTGNPDILNHLSKLNEKEMRILLYKCFQKIVDLRDSSRQLEIQLLQMEEERTEWELRERALLNQYQQLCLESERHAITLQKRYEAILTKLLQKHGEDYGSSSTMTNDSSIATLSSLFQEISPKYPSTSHRHQIGNGFHDYGRSTRTSHRRVGNGNNTAIATTSKRDTDLVDPYHKHKPKNFLSKILNPQKTIFNISHHGPSGSMLPVHSHQPLPESKVTINHGKIIIQQNRS